MLILLVSMALAAPTTVVVVRHAEKAAGDNPSLTEAGQQRAQALTQLLRSVDFDAVYSTDLCRTTQTVVVAAGAQPLQLLPLAGADLSACTPAITHPVQLLPPTEDPHADLIARIRALPPGSQVLVGGHSNTVPAIVEGLGASVCPELFPLDAEGRCWLPNDAYDNVFVVTLSTETSLVRLRYGVPTDPAD